MGWNATLHAAAELQSPETSKPGGSGAEGGEGGDGGGAGGEGGEGGEGKHVMV